MGSGPECPCGCSSRLSVAWGVHETLGGGNWLQIMTAHQLLPFSYLFTQQLGLAGMWIDRHTLTETCLIIHQDCAEENDWETLLFVGGCVVVLCPLSGSIPQADNTQFIITSKCVLNEVFTADISEQFSFRRELSSEPRHDRKVLLQRYAGPSPIALQWIIYDHHTT